MQTWWFYLAAAFAGAFLTNGVPHFTNGISGRRFPSPFSGGPGTEDSAVRNVLWGSANFVIGGALLWLIRDGLSDPIIVGEIIVFGVAFATMLGSVFGNPEKFRRR